jgi:hypothetical protein
MAGECDSDNWATLAEKVDNYIHLFYVNDKDAGSIPQTEGSITDNPMLYLRVPVSELGVKENSVLPSDFHLSQNYPNPFNAQTRIDFSLNKPSNVKLELFDIRGAYLATLLDSKKQAGPYSVNWDASKVSSGAYFYRLKTEQGTQSKRMILIK